MRAQEGDWAGARPRAGWGVSLHILLSSEPEAGGGPQGQGEVEKRTAHRRRLPLPVPAPPAPSSQCSAAQAPRVPAPLGGSGAAGGGGRPSLLPSFPPRSWPGHIPPAPGGGGGVRRRSRARSTPCRSPGSRRTRSRRPRCRSPGRRAGRSRRTRPSRSSSSRGTSPRSCRSRTWRSPGRCYTASGTRRTSRTGCSGHSSLRAWGWGWGTGPVSRPGQEPSHRGLTQCAATLPLLLRPQRDEMRGSASLWLMTPRNRVTCTHLPRSLQSGALSPRGLDSESLLFLILSHLFNKPTWSQVPGTVQQVLNMPSKC